MTANQAVLPLQAAARVLKVSRSGLHAWSSRPPSRRALADVQPCGRVARVHLASREAYGAPRTPAELADGGVRVGRKRVERPLRLKALAGVSRRKGTRATIRDVRLRPAGDLVDRAFAAERPNQLWGEPWSATGPRTLASDLVRAPALVGFPCLAVALDAFSRRIVGGAMGHDLKARAASSAP